MKHIVITSIFPPTKAVEEFSRLQDYSLTVAGDLKSPSEWECPGAEFLSVDRQSELGFSLEPLLPHNHYCRKLVGYLHAVRQGASVIVDTDDDNLPYPDWGFPPFDGEYRHIEDSGYVNIYRRYSAANIWPRGFPLRLVTASYGMTISESEARPVRVGVWQGLADDDPDVDAVYRLTDDTPCTFARQGPIVLPEGTVTPFNSQNTAFRREAFPLLYLPSTVTFRFTDILRGLIAQPILWAAGLRLGFLDATVRQERNLHDYLADFRSEVPMYLEGEASFELAVEKVRGDASIADNLYNVYSGLCEREVVGRDEMPRLEAWLADLAKY